MKKKRLVPRIRSLCAAYPHSIEHLSLPNLRLTDDTSLEVRLEYHGAQNTHSIGLVFSVPTLSKTVDFHAEFKLTDLPKADISTRVMAEATENSANGFDFEKLGERIFATVIAKRGMITIELIHAETSDDLADATVRFSVIASKLMDMVEVPFPEVSRFFIPIDEEE